MISRSEWKPKLYFDEGRTLRWSENLSEETKAALERGEVFTLLGENGEPYTQVLMDSWGSIKERPLSVAAGEWKPYAPGVTEALRRAFASQYWWARAREEERVQIVANWLFLGEHLRLSETELVDGATLQRKQPRLWIDGVERPPVALPGTLRAAMDELRAAVADLVQALKREMMSACARTRGWCRLFRKLFRRRRFR